MTLSMRVGHVILPTQLIWHTTDLPTYIPTYRHICEISIEHPTLGLASQAQLEKWFPIQGERNHSSYFWNFFFISN